MLPQKRMAFSLKHSCDQCRRVKNEDKKLLARSGLAAAGGAIFIYSRAFSEEGGVIPGAGLPGVAAVASFCGLIYFWVT